MTDIEKMDSEQIKALRARMGLTQHEFAEEIGVRPIAVSRWECGTRKPSRLAEAQLRRLLIDNLPVTH